MAKAVEKDKELVPELRFPEFKGSWACEKLGKVTSFSKGKGISKSDVVENGALPCVRYGELYTTYNAVIDTPESSTNIDESELVISQGGEVLIPASGEDALDIATAVVVLRKGVAIGGDLNILRSKLNSLFLSYNLTHKNRHEIARLAQGNSVVHVYSSQLSQIPISYPEKKEQLKIVAFLTTVEHKINKLREKYKTLQTYKRGMIQQIFSQQVRFKQKDGSPFPDWKEQKVSSMGKVIKGNGLSKSVIKPVGRYKCILYGELFTKYSELIGNVDSFTDSQDGVFSQFGDVLMPTSDVTPSGLATASALLEADVKLGGDMNILRLKNKYSPILISYLLNFNKRTIMRLVTGTTIKHIYAKDLLELSLCVPSSSKEQKIIADFLLTIDRKIHAIEAKVKQMETFKKGLLQKMFV